MLEQLTWQLALSLDNIAPTGAVIFEDLKRSRGKRGRVHRQIWWVSILLDVSPITTTPKLAQKGEKDHDRNINKREAFQLNDQKHKCRSIITSAENLAN